jgi:hypothetical protein
MNSRSIDFWKTAFTILIVMSPWQERNPLSGQELQSASVTRNATANDIGFRVDADIYADESKPPIAQFKTLFTGNRSIEIDVVSGDVVVVDSSLGVIQAFSASRRVMTEIELSKIESMLQATLAQSPSEQPPTITTEEGNLVAGDAVVQYRSKTQSPQVPIVAVRYIEFADWTTKLSAVFPPYKPPQLRLKLNEQLKNEKLLPLEIKRTTRSKSGTQEIVSKLIVNYSLSIDDNKEIVRVAGMVNDYKIVAAKEFFARK